MTTYVDVVASSSGDLIAASEHGGPVHVWTVDPLEPIAVVATQLDQLGARLAVARVGGEVRISTGAFARPSVATYDARSGRRLWIRTGLPPVQRISFARNGTIIAASFDRGPMELLDGRTGETVGRLRGARAYWDAAHRPVAVIARWPGAALVDTRDWSVRWSARIGGFDVLASTVSDAAVLLSDAVSFDGPDRAAISCYSIAGEQLWSRECRRDTNVPWLGWDEESGEWLGVEHQLMGAEVSGIVRWNRHGDVVRRSPIPSALSYAFAAGGRRLATSEGAVLSTRDGHEVGRLDGAG